MESCLAIPISMKHSLRIIGGQWKGRRLKVPSIKELRPSPDPVRETLFNWIGSHVDGARAVDLFAGTGSLGFEALSRGASHVTFIDRNRHAVASLRQACQQFDLSATQATVVSANCIRWLRENPREWDIAFIDPPFRQSRMYGRVLQILGDCLTANGIVYVEFNRRESIERQDYTVWKTSTSGEVQFEVLIPSSTESCPANIRLNESLT